MSKNPFIVLDNALSPYICESVINDLIISEDIDETKNQTTQRPILDETLIQFITKTVTPYYPKITEVFGAVPNKIENILFTYMSGSSNETKFKSNNSVFMNNQWVRNEYNDFTITLLLTSYYNPKEPIDREFESLGGQLQFPQHNISIYPDRGGVIIHPSDNHFIKNNCSIAQGTCVMIDVLVSCKDMYLYNPIEFSMEKKK